MATSAPHPVGILPSQSLEQLMADGSIRLAQPAGAKQIQPASMDVRLGFRVYRVRASFLPGRGRTVAEQLERLSSDVISLEGEGERAFCAGADISQFGDNRSGADAVAHYDKAVEAGNRALAAGASARDFDPAVVGWPATSNKSLIDTASPARGGNGAPADSARSAAAALSVAQASNLRKNTCSQDGPSAAASEALSNSLALIRPLRKAQAASCRSRTSRSPERWLAASCWPVMPGSKDPNAILFGFI